MSQSSPTQAANDRAKARAREEIKRRTADGEFGHPPNDDLRDEAWMEILEQELSNRQPRTCYHQVTALWHDKGYHNDSNKVLYSGHTQEQVTIPKGVKVLVLKKTPEEGTRQPNANIVYVTLGDKNMTGPTGLTPPRHVRFDEAYGSQSIGMFSPLRVVLLLFLFGWFSSLSSFSSWGVF
jgi:hypothetical protein